MTQLVNDSHGFRFPLSTHNVRAAYPGEALAKKHRSGPNSGGRTFAARSRSPMANPAHREMHFRVGGQ